MADLTITAANVLPGIGAVTRSGTAGETVTAGQSLYRKPSDGKVYKANASGLANRQNTCVGVAAGGASAGQTVSFYVGGQVAIGATVAVGQTYVVSAAASGGVAPLADVLTAGDMTTLIGVADTTTTILLVPGFLANNQPHA